MNSYYPVFLDLREKKCLIIGGGKVASRKVGRLLSCRARVTVISLSLVPGLRSMVDNKVIKYLEEPYCAEHLEGAFLVIGAADDEETNSKVASDCFARNIPVNIVDNPSLCSFFVPSLVKRGYLGIAISTEGRSPALARLLREELESRLEQEYSEFVTFLGELRPRIKREIPDPQKRKAFFLEVAGRDFFMLFKTLPSGELEEKIAEIIKRFKAPS